MPFFSFVIFYRYMCSRNMIISSTGKSKWCGTQLVEDGGYNNREGGLINDKYF